MNLDAPLLFAPVYKVVLWGGRRFERWRQDLPEGPVGESWELADHASGMSVVASGPLAGTTLRTLTERHGAELVGRGFRGGAFPILIKLIDATDLLSVQVHPDDALARSLGVGENGKTECWLMLDDGGELYQGTRPGVDRAMFERALQEGRLAETLNHYRPTAGDFFFMKARTVHALGAGCMVYELQQTLDITFRVYDWGRVGADGKARPLHVREALETIDFGASGFGPQRSEWSVSGGRRTRQLTECPYFTLGEVELAQTGFSARTTTCSVLTCLAGEGTVTTPGGEAQLRAGRTVVVPAAAGSFEVKTTSRLHFVDARPRL
jgi:mannose-6-phosphate isomerase